MNAPVVHDRPEPDRLETFLDLLRARGFAGDIAGDEASRLVSATDNSIYQVLPAALLFPRTGEDLRIAAELASDPRCAPIPLTARGGGTGTNGQSLTRGVVVDTSRHMNRILSLDADRCLVTVEPGVVLDQLNRALAAHGLFFPPTVSTATRATIGGMIATDASGKGSRLYGKTSDYVACMDVVLADGSDFRVEPMSAARLEALCAEDSLAGRACAEVRRVVGEQADEIARVFPRMNRGLTGYNLQRTREADGRFTLHRVLAGSEGTLALTKAVTLRVMARPKRRALAIVRYASVEAALADVGRLLRADPLAVEFLDDKVIALARRDVVWSGIGEILGGERDELVKGMNFVEFVGNDDDAIAAGLRSLDAVLSGEPSRDVLDWTLCDDPALIAQLWTLREKSVGLLGKVPGQRQGTAFVEDAAVPPEALPAFVRDLRAILDRHGLSYGMYGHADVGCLHVRPLLDMKDAAEAALIRPISDEVAQLARRYGGLLWGEHGRGFRGEYSPFFFGPVLYGELCRIKAAFDPLNILNPGKLASSPGGMPVQPIDAPPLRGAFDATIAPENAEGFERALACNGNGVCFTWDADEAMCPSYKATRDRTQSPKGRATLLREWARRRGKTQAGSPDPGLAAIEAALHSSLSTCLACKACVSQCPVQVDIPSMKARFLEVYHRTRRRSLRDHLVANLEALLPLATLSPGTANRLIASRLGRRILEAIGLVDLPAFSARPFRGTRGGEAAPARPNAERAVILVPDTFTSAFDAAVPEAAERLLRRLGYDVHVAPLLANGKSLHVLGFLPRFAAVARKARAMHESHATRGVPLVGLEAVTTLMDRHEYRVPAERPGPPPVLTLDEFLADEIEKGRIRPRTVPSSRSFSLFAHCTERTAMPRVGSRWRTVFSAFGLSLEEVRTGCCGMSGLFGHEREHLDLSKRLFAMSWREPLAAAGHGGVAVSGFSCRCQVKRLTGRRPPHPIEILADMLESPDEGGPEPGGPGGTGLSPVASAP